MIFVSNSLSLQCDKCVDNFTFCSILIGLMTWPVLNMNRTVVTVMGLCYCDIVRFGQDMQCGTCCEREVVRSISEPVCAASQRPTGGCGTAPLKGGLELLCNFQRGADGNWYCSPLRSLTLGDLWVRLALERRETFVSRGSAIRACINTSTRWLR
jgi:hypothetical protein